MSGIFHKRKKVLNARLSWRLGVLTLAFCFAGVLNAQSVTPALSPANTNSPTATLTPTPSLTPTKTFTPVPTFTPTRSFTFTPTVTGTRSPSPTPTLTLTPTFSPTVTGTPTNSPTGTLSPTLSPTPSSTFTQTITKTPTKTPTTTPTTTSTPGVFKFIVSPKPDEQNLIHFLWGATFQADQAYLRVYTSGFRLVWETDFSKKEKPDYLTAGTHQITWNGKDDEGRPMPPDEYLCFISVTAGKKTYEASGKTDLP